MRHFNRKKQIRNHRLSLHNAKQQLSNKTSKLSEGSTVSNKTNDQSKNSTSKSTPSNNTTSKPDATSSKNQTIPNNTTSNKSNTTKSLNTTTAKNTTSTDQTSTNAIHIPWVPILIAIGSILLITLIIWLIYTIYKRRVTTRQYNQTPQNFTQTPALTLNQTRNLKQHKIKHFTKYQKDVTIQQVTQYGGSIYQITFNSFRNQNYSAAYWSKVLKTDCYFEVEVHTLNSEIEFGFFHQKYFGLVDAGIQTKIGRIGVSLNSEGNLQLLGQVKYQYRWNLQYGDIVGLGITNIQSSKRIWVTKNGILLNPPTSDQIQKWLNKQSLTDQHRQAYTGIINPSIIKPINKKQDMQLIKKKVSLPSTQSFDYYAAIGTWKMDQLSKNKLTRDSNDKNKTIVRFNAGGKIFRLRDDNLKSGLLADSIQKNQFCNWLPCF